MDQTQTSVGKILVVDPGSPDFPHVVEHLRQLGEVQVEPGLEPALAALKREHFALVVGPAESFGDSGSLGDSGVAGLGSQLGTVLNTIGQGVGIIDPQGHILWSNAPFSRFPPEIRGRVLAECAEYGSLAELPQETTRLRSLSLVTEEDQHFDATITSFVHRGATRLVAVISDVTRARQLQKKIDAIDNAGRELVHVDVDQLPKMGIRERLDLLERKIIRYTGELLNFDNFAICLLDRKTNKLEIVTCMGLPPEAQEVDIYASTENNGITGYVAATGRSYICPDVQRDPRYLRGIKEARSSLTVPLMLHDHVVGTLNIESRRPAAFSEDDRQFAEIFGRYIAIALHILEVLVMERYTTRGRLADNVSTEIAGPLGDILADATTLMEDYIGHDDLRRRLSAITDNVARIKESVKHAAQPEDGLLGTRPTQPQTDPLLAGKSVMVIDDEDIIRQTVRDVLTKFGCQVETAREGPEGLAMINQRSYDLVITDIRMPGYDGYEIFRAVKTRNSACPVIFMTGFGYDPNHSIIRAQPEGLSAVLYKPFKVDQLLQEVRAAVCAPRA